MCCFCCCCFRYDHSFCWWLVRCEACTWTNPNIAEDSLYRTKVFEIVIHLCLCYSSIFGTRRAHCFLTLVEQNAIQNHLAKRFPWNWKVHSQNQRETNKMNEINLRTEQWCEWMKWLECSYMHRSLAQRIKYVVSLMNDKLMSNQIYSLFTVSMELKHQLSCWFIYRNWADNSSSIKYVTEKCPQLFSLSINNFHRTFRTIIRSNWKWQAANIFQSHGWKYQDFESPTK